MSAAVVPNGTRLPSTWLPAIGYQRSYELQGPGERRDHGLPPRSVVPALEDADASAGRSGGMAFEAVVGTHADQTAVAPGAMKAVGRSRGRGQLEHLLRFMRQPHPYPTIRRGEPLLRGLDPYMAYRRGPLALYALSEHELFEVNTFWALETRQATAQPKMDGTWQVTLDVRARTIVYDEAGAETQMPVNDWIEIGVYAAGDKDWQPVAADSPRTVGNTGTVTAEDGVTALRVTLLALIVSYRRPDPEVRERLHARPRRAGILSSRSCLSPDHPSTGGIPVRTLPNVWRGAVAALALTLVPCSAHAQSDWAITDLGTLGGLFGEAEDINDVGHVVGSASPATGSNHAFLWTEATGMTDLGTLGGPFSVAFAVNNQGQVVGMSSPAVGPTMGFLWTEAGGMVNLTTLGLPAGSIASDINDAGQIVGQAPAAGFTLHAFLWTPGEGMVDLGTLGGANSNARAINELGQVVGTSGTATGEERAFVWMAATGMIDLGTLGGANSGASDINELGHVVGRADLANGVERAFLWTAGGGMTNLGTLGAAGERSVAQGINDAGETVGHFLDDLGEERGFYWTAAGGMVELPTLTGIESDAFAVNNAGRIAGSADIETGDAHAVVWTKIDGPPTPPEEQIQNLASTVTALVTAGSLKPGQANGLIRPLQNALRSLENGRFDASCNQLADFQTEVARKVADGALSAAEGDTLTADAEAIRAAIGCGGSL